MASTYRAEYKHKSSLALRRLGLHGRDMHVGERIAAARKAKRLSQAALGKLVNQAQTTISSWERGRTEPTREDVERVATALDVPLEQLEQAGRARQVETVPVVGYVGAGAEAHFYDVGQQELDRVTAPEGATESTVGVEVRGVSLGPLFEHWLVYYDEVRRPVTDDLIGRLCVVGLPDGRVLVKRLRRSRAPGLYHLESNTEPTMPDEEVVWAARVRNMTPR